MKNLKLVFLGLVLTFIPKSLLASKQCFSLSLEYPYPCCKENNIIYIDEFGEWGVENGEWCGIGGDSSDSCFSLALGYPCCETCKVIYTSDSGKWGKENRKWCGIKDSCSIQDVQEEKEFDFLLLKMESEEKNILYSPLSIKYALSMLRDGATSNTYTEISNVVGNAELPKYENIQSKLSTGNGIFIKDKYYKFVKENYINTLKEKYDAEIVQDKFESASNMNNWVSKKTLGIIKRLLTDEVVQKQDNILFLVNALALNMNWYDPFNINDTKGEFFYLENGDLIEATTMKNKELKSSGTSYYKDDEVTALEMDLNSNSDSKFEFLALMPKENLNDYIQNISKEKINQIFENLKSSDKEAYGVTVYLPKFKFDFDLDLKEDLKELGINDAFDEKKADFSKMIDLEKLQEETDYVNVYVSDAFHRAEIDLSETGVKAAAASYFGMSGAKSLVIPKYPVVININKPFMFVIRDSSSKQIWFTGKVYSPNLWKDDKSQYGVPSSGSSHYSSTKTIPSRYGY